jgi:hypothetical protein
VYNDLDVMPLAFSNLQGMETIYQIASDSPL